MHTFTQLALLQCQIQKAIFIMSAEKKQEKNKKLPNKFKILFLNRCSLNSTKSSV